MGIFFENFDFSDFIGIKYEISQWANAEPPINTNSNYKIGLTGGNHTRK